MGNFLTKEEAGKPFEFQVVNDIGVKIDWHISVVGIDSQLYRDKQEEQRQQNIAETARTRNMASSLQRAEAQALELLAAATTGWRGKDQVAEFSTANAARIYGEFQQIRDQVAAKIGDRESFLRRAASNS
jgi:hypothetical protein